MKVILFIDTLGTGGAERQFSLMANGLADRGHSVNVVTLYPRGQNWKWLVTQKTASVRSLFSEKSQSTVGTGRQFVQAIYRLRKVIRAQKPMAVYSGSYWCNLIGYLASLGLTTATVWGVRASDMKLGWKQAIPHVLSKWVSSDVDLAIANSFAGRDYHARNGYDVRSWQVVPNGIDTKRFRPNSERGQRVRKEWNATPKDTLIGTVARLAPMKDYPTLLRAASQLTNENPDLRFIMAGSGKPAYERELRNLTQELGLADSVLWLGKCTDVEAVYNALDLFVLPSAYGEGWPNVIGEALACGVPCVATDVGDVSQLLSQDRLVPPRSPDALAEGIKSALEGERRGREDLRGRIEEGYSVEQLVRQTEKALASVGSGSTRSGTGCLNGVVFGSPVQSVR